ncbi:uracil-DNA glycosylase [Micromonospora sp. RHAY321]|uniref:uracil-DNA glycosylase n=1 Tax=Micromonospora sp. RHAY321 TaxID=2944807 RepID=UPI00207C3A32|nr:uracil-DNA glycosylase [Micromonospora sp. RHAY321]MCO1594866.1 uracil-DNA glycosylase [Micromonospora sp. RHAY321]
MAFVIDLPDDPVMDLPGAARVNRNPDLVTAKLARLHEPHIAPITDLVEELRAERGDQSVPYVDPTLGGVHAQVLFLLETPARAAALGSSMLSPDNDDSTAAHVWEFYRASGLRRDRCLHWNAVPWFMGDEKKNKGATRSDIEPGLPWLARLIDLLPALRLVVTMGGIARQAFALYLLREEAKLVPWLAVAHPSPRVRNTNYPLWQDIARAFEIAGAVVVDRPAVLVGDAESEVLRQRRPSR